MHEPAEFACQAQDPIALERLLQGWRILTTLISQEFVLELKFWVGRSWLRRISYGNQAAVAIKLGSVCAFNQRYKLLRI